VGFQPHNAFVDDDAAEPLLDCGHEPIHLPPVTQDGQSISGHQLAKVMRGWYVYFGKIGRDRIRDLVNFGFEQPEGHDNGTPQH
jgi:hypothetical protein